MLVGDFRDYLEGLFPTVTFYNGTIDRNKKECVGIYARGSYRPYIALGGLSNTSFATLPISILVHWTHNSDACERQANDIYKALSGVTDEIVGDKRIISFDMLDSGPVDIQRDVNNICEMVIRLNIQYER